MGKETPWDEDMVMKHIVPCEEVVGRNVVPISEQSDAGRSGHGFPASAPCLRSGRLCFFCFGNLLKFPQCDGFIMTERDSTEASFCEPTVRIVLHKTLPHSHAVNRHADVLNMVLLRDTFRSFKLHVSRYLEPLGDLGKIEGEHDFRRHPEKGFRHRLPGYDIAEGGNRSGRQQNRSVFDAP